MSKLPARLIATVQRIRASELSIYDDLAARPQLYFRTDDLELVLDAALRGMNLDYPIRTRSKIVKRAICAALGYPVPPSFKRTKPRFPGQNFDAYTQKADNLQIWNEQVSSSRRYVLIRVDASCRVVRVRVVTGEVLAALDPTGTLTHKYQAKSIHPVAASVLASERDSAAVLAEIVARSRGETAVPGQPPTRLLPIAELFARLQALVGRRFPNPGLTQERNRGALLHRMVQEALGDIAYHDSGQFPDVPQQLLELKLQTAPTVDLGLNSPDSPEPLSASPALRHCDVRYAVFYASVESAQVVLKNLVMVRGEEFFRAFRRFEGKVKNSKLQIPLPRAFFGNAE
jgi:hypothetical protein